MRPRTKARSVALQYLYQLEVSKEPYDQANMIEFFDYEEIESDVREYATKLLRGVNDNLVAIDELISTCLNNWHLGRIAIVDKNILRMATYELLHVMDVPAKVAVNEAIELGKLFGSKDSGGFINGILDRIMRNKALV